MTHKSHTKLVSNHIVSNKTPSHFLTNIKSIGAYSLLPILFALFTMTAIMTPAQAELIDPSPKPVIQLATRDASWLRPPSFNQTIQYMDRYFINCSYDQDDSVIRSCERTDLEMVFSLRVDKKGRIKDIKVIKSSGKEVIDKKVTRELYKARFKPFLTKGRAVEGNVTLPIEFK